LKKIEKLIKPVGFYKTKARYVKKLSKILLNDFEGRVPDSMEELMRLPGVGRKVAACVLVYRENGNRVDEASSKTILDLRQQPARASRAKHLPAAPPKVRELRFERRLPKRV